MKEALYIGRFQPFHNGHLTAINSFAEVGDISSLTIGIGSSNRSFEFKNPFTADERQKMIEGSVELGIPFSIKQVPDLGDNELWTKQVLQQNPESKVVYTANPLVAKLMNEAGLEVRAHKMLEGVSATEVRKMMLRGLDWHYFVPEGTRKVIDKVCGVDRLRAIYCRYLKPSVTVDALINFKDEGLVYIKRLNQPFKGDWAWPGGFVDYGVEDTKQAARRELKEETNLIVDVEDLNLLGVYSRVDRDPREHVISIAYYASVSEGELKASDDAQEVKTFPLNNPPENLAFDHSQMYRDLMNLTKNKAA